MKTLDLSFFEPALNLACDEVLLDEVNEDTREPTLRFWESPHHFVVVGYGNSIETECRVAACEKLGIPILRRSSGGGTVLQGPGCLNYSLILRVSEQDLTKNISATNCHVMKTNRSAVGQALGQAVEIEGHTDLAVDGVKFSGNAQRRKRNALLFHGTFLLDFDITLLGQALMMPSVAPDYRDDRPHDSFCRNVPLTPDALKEALGQAWQTQGPARPIDAGKVQQLAKSKYSVPEWIHRRTKLGQASE